MVFNTTFYNISVISWRSVLLEEETGETTDLPQVTGKLYHIMSNQVKIAWAGFKHTTLVEIGTGCTGSSKCHYHKITSTTTPSIHVLNLDTQDLNSVKHGKVIGTQFYLQIFNALQLELRMIFSCLFLQTISFHCSLF